MKPMVDSFWRAAVYGLHPQVLALSLLPFLVLGVLSLGLGYLFWHDTVAALDVWFHSNTVALTLQGWLEGLGVAGVLAVLPPLLVLLVATPLMVLLSVLSVGILMTPSMVNLVAARRYPQLQRKKGASFTASVAYALASTVMALGLLLLSMPLWLLPPLFMLLPPMIWGWLNYRMFAFDALADHASAQERKQLMDQHRYRYWAMGVICGFLGTLPSVLWASGVLWLVLAPVLLPLAMWVYTMVFAFSALWFVHFSLDALHLLRSQPIEVAMKDVSTVPSVPAPAGVLELPAPPPAPTNPLP
jgi:hypothetical protein